MTTVDLHLSNGNAVQMCHLDEDQATRIHQAVIRFQRDLHLRRAGISSGPEQVALLAAQDETRYTIPLAHITDVVSYPDHYDYDTPPFQHPWTIRVDGD